MSYSFVNKVFDNYNKVTYLQKNKICYNLGITFQEKLKFSEQFIYLRSYYMTTLQIPVPAALIFSLASELLVLIIDHAEGCFSPL